MANADTRVSFDLEVRFLDVPYRTVCGIWYDVHCPSFLLLLSRISTGDECHDTRGCLIWLTLSFLLGKSYFVPACTLLFFVRIYFTEYVMCMFQVILLKIGG